MNLFAELSRGQTKREGGVSIAEARNNVTNSLLGISDDLKLGYLLSENKVEILEKL